MTANPILLQRKFARIISLFAERSSLSLDAALDFFYRSKESQLLHEGVSDLHCMSDAYIVEDLLEEYRRTKEMA